MIKAYNFPNTYIKPNEDAPDLPDSYRDPCKLALSPFPNWHSFHCLDQECNSLQDSYHIAHEWTLVQNQYMYLKPLQQPSQSPVIYFVQQGGTITSQHHLQPRFKGCIRLAGRFPPTWASSSWYPPPARPAQTSLSHWRTPLRIGMSAGGVWPEVAHGLPWPSL